MTSSSCSPSDLARRSFSRILLIKPSSLGDVVHALPVLHGLRVRYPQATIDWLVASPFVPLVESHPDLNEVIVFDRSRYSRIGRSATVTADFVRFVQDLRGRRYELAIDLQGLFRTGFLAWASGAGVRIGFRDAREASSVFYTHRLARDPLDTHAVDRNYRLSAVLGFEEVRIEFNLALTDRVRAEAHALLCERGVGPDERMTVVAPGARWETKVWLPERFAATIDRLQQSECSRCVLIGGPAEVSLCHRIERACRTSPVNLAGKTSLPVLSAVIERAELVLCHDSAAMHLAVALERPLVCLIGPTNPLRTGPYRRPEEVVRVDVECAPCYLRKLSQCGHDHRCMKELEVSSVLAAVERRLEMSALRPRNLQEHGG